MDLNLILQIMILLGSIFLGIRLGGIGIGFAGGLGVIILGLGFGMAPGDIPWDVILIIMSVIAAIATMQLAGGLDFLVKISEKILRSNPKHINYLAPAVTYFLTLFAGTGHTAFSMMPVIIEVSKEENITPSAPLSISVVSSQIAITASPVSAAVIYMSSILEPFNWSYPLLLAIWIPTTFFACMLTAFIITKFTNLDLKLNKDYQTRLQAGLVKPAQDPEHIEIKPHAKLSVLIFLIGVLFVVSYATAISRINGEPILIANAIVSRDAAIIASMLAVATFITIICKVDTNSIAKTSVFQSGMVACVCVLGVAWLGNTFVSGYTAQISNLAAHLVSKYPALLVLAFFFASTLLYSQAATAKAIAPVVILALGITPKNPQDSYILVSSFAAVSALFILPTYPTLIGAVQMDDTGTTKIGKLIFNHSFLIPGLLAIIFSVTLSFMLLHFII